jgi:hypothetical protein
VTTNGQTLTGLLRLHRQVPVLVDNQWVYFCICDREVRSTDEYEIHVASALIRAGVGFVTQAKAEERALRRKFYEEGVAQAKAEGARKALLDAADAPRADATPPHNWGQVSRWLRTRAAREDGA